MNTQTVNVTAEHIAEGFANSWYGNPIAKALNAATGNEWTVGVTWAFALHVAGSYRVDNQLGNVIESFDTIGTMSPLTLIIDHDAKTITVQS